MDPDTQNDTQNDTRQTPTGADELPVFPAAAPAVFADPAAATALLAPVLDDLAEVVTVSEGALANRSPCEAYTVAELRDHVLAWLQFFAAALTDPDGTDQRLNPSTWTVTSADDPAAIVHDAATDMATAIKRGVAGRLVVMSQARMSGDAVVAMALGEYIVHGWDLATATGRPWSVADDAADAARVFLEGTVSPEFRGPDSGFFDAEVAVPTDATPLDRLLGFAGRDPHWRP